MIKTLRLAMTLIAVLAAGVMATHAAAQETDTYILRVGITLTPAGELTGGQVCFENDFGKMCQDIVPGVPTGYYEFDNITGDTGAVFVEGADPYEGGQGVVLDEGINNVTLNLTLADAPTPTPAPNLPDTGVGTTTDGGSASFLLITGLLGAAGALAAGSALSRRAHR